MAAVPLFPEEREMPGKHSVELALVQYSVEYQFFDKFTLEKLTGESAKLHLGGK